MTMKATVNIDGLHRLSSFHRRAVLSAPRIGCFFCLRFHSPKEIKGWTDHRKTQDWSKAPKPKNGKTGLTMAQLKKIPTRREGQTALCPHCGIDSVLPDVTYGFTLNKKLLSAMCERWFTAEAPE